MKVIIAGSRGITNYECVKEAIEKSGFKITEVVCGMAAGVDLLGKKWADDNKIPVKEMPADWSNITIKGAVIKEGKWGKYNVKAGFDRNEEMAEYAEALIAVNLGTPGTDDMIERAKSHNLKVYIHYVGQKVEKRIEFKDEN